jgi:phosphoribosylanthranilate isomerase
MKIKVCGMRDAENIREVSLLGVDMIGLVFYDKSPRFVSMINSVAGTIPDYSQERLNRIKNGESQAANEKRAVKRVGVFVDEMPQSIITRVYNYDIDYIQMHGSEGIIEIDNLRATIDPDIHKDIKFIKTISISKAEDLEKCKEYEGHADLLLFDTKCDEHGGSGEQFDWNILKAYDGKTPFILSGGIGPDDVERIKAFNHPMLYGIDVNSKFETEPAMKDVNMLKSFIDKLKN